MNIAWFLAEFIGTFTLIFIGAGSVCLNEMIPNSLGIVGIAFAHGLAIAVMISAIGHISGGKLNPAVTLGLLIGGKVDRKATIYEIIAQLSGAVLGALCLKLIFPVAVTQATHLGTPELGQGISVGIGIFTEAILSFFLVFTVYGTAVDPRGTFRSVAGFGIGCAIIFAILGFAGITGVAINPARAFGPALVSGYWSHHYIYWIGPIIGGLCAGLLYSKLMLKEPRENAKTV